MEKFIATSTQYATEPLTKDMLLKNIVPILYPMTKIPNNIVRTKVKGMDDIGLVFAYEIGDGKHVYLDIDTFVDLSLSYRELLRSINSRNHYCTFDSLSQIVGKERKESPLYMVSKQGRKYGAAAIVLRSVLEQLCDFFKCNFYILPSSLHEVMVMPVSDAVSDADGLLDMVKRINQKEIEPEDWLADHVYMMDYEKRCLCTVA